MKKRILVLIDFSENSWTATRYAAYLAQTFNWTLQLLHSYSDSLKDKIDHHFEGVPPVSKKEKAEFGLNELGCQVQQEFTDLNYETICLPGKLTETVSNLLSQDQYSFVVMGAKGGSKIKLTLLGSNTVALIKSCPIGILAVPIKMPKFRLKNVGMLTNFKDSEFDLLEGIKDNLSLEFNLDLLHVTEGYKSAHQEDVAQVKRKSAIMFPLSHIDYVEKKAVYRLDYRMPIPSCIDYMVRSRSIDLLLVSYNQKSFFKQLFSRSLKKAIYQNLSVPTYFKRTAG